MHVVVRLALWASLVAIPIALTSCTVVRVKKDPGPAMLRADGLIDGHAAIGFTDEERILNVSILGGRSSGALAEVVIWKLLRVEAGLAGVSLGIGPFHLGLGTLFYDPSPPSIPVRKKKPKTPEPTPEKEAEEPAEPEVML